MLSCNLSQNASAMPTPMPITIQPDPTAISRHLSHWRRRHTHKRLILANVVLLHRAIKEWTEPVEKGQNERLLANDFSLRNA
jgi:hypothetical protein